MAKDKPHGPVSERLMRKFYGPSGYVSNEGSGNLTDPLAGGSAAAGDAEMSNADELLRELVTALDGAFISSWQSTAAWQKQLDAAREYVNRAYGCG